MANYATLKTAIQQAIYQNGTNAITGLILQQSLLSMIDALGSGYQFAGVAVPSTNPGTPDQKVFYIGLEPGVYSNFGGTEIQVGGIGVFYYDTGWHYVSRGIVLTNSNTQIPNATIVSGEYIANNGSVQSSANFSRTSLITLPKGHTAVIFGRGYSTNIAMISKYASGAYSSLANSIDGADRKYSYYNDTDGDLQICFSFNSNFAHSYFITDNLVYSGLQNVLSEIAALGQSISGLNTEIDDAQFMARALANTTIPTANIVAGEYVASNGSIQQSANFSRTSDITLPKNSAIVVIGRGYLTGVAMIAKHASGVYSSLKNSVDDTERRYSYFNDTENSISVCLSFNSNYPHAYFITDNIIYENIANLDAGLDEILEEINRIESQYNGGTYTPGLGTPTAGKFVDLNGDVSSSSGFSMTTPFYVPKGGSISVKAAGYNTNVAILSKIDELTERCIPVVLSVDSTLRTYLAQNVDGGNYVVSYHTSDGLEISVTSVNIWETVDGISSQLGNTDLLFTNGKRIALDGGIGSVVDVNVFTWDSSYRYSVVPCNPGDVFLINGAGGGSPRLWGFLDENNKLISVAAPNSTGINLLLTAPKYAVTLVVNDNQKTGQICKLGTNDVYQVVNESVQENIFAAFDNILAFGDSLTYSSVYTEGNNSRQARVTYPAVVARLSGNVATVVASGGADASYMWEHYQDSINPKTNGIAILYLGTNNGLSNTVSTDAAGTNPDAWANNNTGDYCRIVNKMIAQGYKVLLLRPWVSSGVLADTIAAINDIAEKFNVAVMDAPATREPKYHLWTNGIGQNTVHLNDIGYCVFAERLIAQASKLGDTMLSRIFPA